MSATHADVSHLAKAMLGGHVSAMADRGNRSPEDKAARARDLWAVIASCEPQNAIQTILIGQALMLNELIADGGRDVLAGMMDTLKSRAQSNVNGMSRALHQHIATFLRLRDKSDAVIAMNATVSETVATAQRPLDSAKRPPAPDVAAEASRRDTVIRPPEAIQPAPDDPGPVPGAGATNMAARADAYGGLNGTHTSVLATNAAADPCHAKPLILKEAESAQSRSDGAPALELAGSALRPNPKDSRVLRSSGPLG